MLLPGRSRRNPQQIAVIKGWAMELLEIAPDASLLVTELDCHDEGCPPVETVIAALVERQPPKQWKLHKPASDVTREDIAQLASGRHPGIHHWRCPD
jgi:hypothetical protein